MSHAAAERMPADLDRRLYAAVLDRVLGWGLIALATWAAAVLFWSGGATWAGLGLVLGVAVVVWLAFALVEGSTGRTPGKALTGLRLLRTEDHRPPGAGPALLRALVLGLGGLPTAGLGLATLAWTAAADPSGRRRGWHDRLAAAEVVDVRPLPQVVEAAPDAPRHVVNLTAMRLAPPAAEPAPVIERPARSAEPSARPAASATQEPPAPPTQLPTWILAFDTGQEIALEGPALLGRSPQPRTGERVAHLLPLPSQDMSVSKTHAQVHVAADGALVVVDRGSTNGSLLLRKGVTRELSAGRATTLLDGDQLRLGDRVVSVRRG